MVNNCFKKRNEKKEKIILKLYFCTWDEEYEGKEGERKKGNLKLIRRVTLCFVGMWSEYD